MNPIASLKQFVGPRIRPYRKLHRDYMAKFDGRLISVDEQLAATKQGTTDLVPESVELHTKGRALRNPYLSRVLAKDRLGEWALDAHTIEFLWKEIQSARPSAILEFGSGISTIILCRFLDEIGTGKGIQIYSVEQNQWQIDQLKERLQSLGMAPRVKLLHAPVSRQTVEGITGDFYTLPHDAVERFLGDAKPEIVIVDGPAGNDISRFGTLTAVKDWLADGTRFYLDDALRLDELHVAAEWAKLPYLDVSGIRAIGKGIAVGQVRRNQAAGSQ